MGFVGSAGLLRPGVGDLKERQGVPSRALCVTGTGQNHQPKLALPSIKHCN